MLAQPPHLPLEACLNADAVRALLQQALPEVAGGRVAIDRLSIVNARRNASRRRNPHPLTLRYQLEVRDVATGSAATREFYGKVYRDGASAAASHGTPALHLPQLDMLLWPWPADPGLPQLRPLMDPNQTCRWWGEPAHAIGALRYEPEQRATLVYTRHTEGGQRQRLYAKTFRDNRGATIHQRFAHFWRTAQHDAQAPRVAEPLGYCEQTQSLWQAQARGVPLADALRSAPAASLADRLAHALAAVHAAPHELAGPEPHDKAHWLTEIRRRRRKIARAAPELASRAATVAEALEQAAVLQPASPPTLIHGDCHAGQVWLDGTDVVLFDFDEFTLGDPMEDLAAFAARLDAVTPDAAFAAQLFAAYQRLAPARFCAYRLRWHLVLQHLLQASRAFVFQVRNWPFELERRLARAEALCTSDVLRLDR